MGQSDAVRIFTGDVLIKIVYICSLDFYVIEIVLILCKVLNILTAFSTNYFLLIMKYMLRKHY